MQQRPMGLGLGGGGGLLGGLNLAGTQKGSVLCSLLTYLVVHLLFSSSSFLLFSLFLSSFFLPSLLSTPLPLFLFPLPLSFFLSLPPLPLYTKVPPLLWEQVSLVSNNSSNNKTSSSRPSKLNSC